MISILNSLFGKEKDFKNLETILDAEENINECSDWEQKAEYALITYEEYKNRPWYKKFYANIFDRPCIDNIKKGISAAYKSKKYTDIETYREYFLRLNKECKSAFRLIKRLTSHINPKILDVMHFELNYLKKLRSNSALYLSVLEYQERKYNKLKNIIEDWGIT